MKMIKAFLVQNDPIFQSLTGKVDFGVVPAKENLMYLDVLKMKELRQADLKGTEFSLKSFGGGEKSPFDKNQ
jgi:hypothetical protein